MEFEEMKKIWDSQNNEMLYVINEQALHRRILSMKRSALHITNASEVLVLLVYLAAGGFVMWTAAGITTNISMFILSVWMLVVAFFMGIVRVKRLRANTEYDRSMQGDLSEALSVARYQVYLSRVLRWNIFPMAVLIALSLWEGHKSLWITLGAIFFFALTYYLSGWEHRYYERRKTELESLQENLQKEQE